MSTPLPGIALHLEDGKRRTLDPADIYWLEARDPRFPSPKGAAYVSPGQRPGYEIPSLSEAL